MARSNLAWQKKKKKKLQIIHRLIHTYFCFIPFAVSATRHDWETYIRTHMVRPRPATDPKVIIIDEKGGPLQDKYYEVDSTIQLSCIVRHVAMTTTAVYWSHGERILNYDVDRGGIRYVCNIT